MTLTVCVIAMVVLCVIAVVTMALTVYNGHGDDGSYCA